LDANKKWWEKPVRMLRVDYAPNFAAIKEEDLDALARSRREDWQINCEWIVGTPGFTGGGYCTTFKATGYELCTGFENFDYLRSYTPYAHKYSIKVIAYLNMHWYPYEFAEAHPGWEQITGNGQSYGRVNPLYGNGTTFCVNSPWREWAFGLMQEAMKTGIDGIFLDGPVIFPDCCCCSSCQQKFQMQYGQAIPEEDWMNPIWKSFLEFREDSLAGFLSDAQKRVQEISPDGVIFLNAGSWGPGGWRIARDIQKTGPFQNFNGAEAFFHYGKYQNIYGALMTGKYLRAGNKPAVVFTHYMNGKWHYLNLPPGEVKLALAQTAAAGTNPWWALINSSLASQPQSNEPIRDMCSLLEKHEEYLIDAESQAEVGLLFSTQTNRNYLSRIEALYEITESGKEENLLVNMETERKVDWPARKKQCEELLHSAYLGYFHALTRAHIPFDILLDQVIMTVHAYSYTFYTLYPFPDSGDKPTEFSRQYIADGIGYIQNCGACIDNSLKHTAKIIGIGPGSVFRRKFYIIGVFSSIGNGIHGHVQNIIMALLQLMGQMNIGGSNKSMDTRSICILQSFPGTINIFTVSPTKPGDNRTFDIFGDRFYRIEITL
jgi:hypothetical protein